MSLENRIDLAMALTMIGILVSRLGGETTFRQIDLDEVAGKVMAEYRGDDGSITLRLNNRKRMN
jgi:hypothetical protein